MAVTSASIGCTRSIYVISFCASSFVLNPFSFYKTGFCHATDSSCHTPFSLHFPSQISVAASTLIKTVSLTKYRISRSRRTTMPSTHVITRPTEITVYFCTKILDIDCPYFRSAVVKINSHQIIFGSQQAHLPDDPIQTTRLSFPDASQDFLLSLRINPHPPFIFVPNMCQP